MLTSGATQSWEYFLVSASDKPTIGAIVFNTHHEHSTIAPIAHTEHRFFDLGPVLRLVPFQQFLEFEVALFAPAPKVFQETFWRFLGQLSLDHFYRQAAGI